MRGELTDMSATDVVAALRSGELSAVEVAEAFLRKIDAENVHINAFTVVTHDIALRAATRCDRIPPESRSLYPLLGVPVAVKDDSDLVGIPTTSGSQALRELTPTAASLHVQRLVDAGAVIVGKTNMPELGHKIVTDNLAFGATCNPFDHGRNAGGSSGGSAAAVAARLVPLAQASDGGGSTRVPASWCGIFGLKPSYGRVPNPVRPNAFALGSPYPSIGPLARGVEDAALMFSVLAVPDDRDPFSLPEPCGTLRAVGANGLAGLRVGYTPDLGGIPVDPEVARVVRQGLSGLEAAGAVVEEVHLRLPADQYELSLLVRRQLGLIYYEQCVALRDRGHDLLGDYLDEGMASELRDLIVAARDRTAWQVRADEWLRSAVYDAVEDAMAGYDLLASPTTSVVAVKNGQAGRTLGPDLVNGVRVDRPYDRVLPGLPVQLDRSPRGVLAQRRRRNPPPLDTATLRLLRAQHGRCPLCEELLLHAEHEPASPREWENWLTATRKALRKQALVARESGTPHEHIATRLIHAHCHRRITSGDSSPAPLPARTPQGLA